jgi:EpsI family protein
MWRRSLLIACCLLATGALLHAGRGRAKTIGREPLGNLPSAIDRWRGQAGPPLEAGTIAALGVDDFVNRVYVRPDVPPVALYIGYYASQREGDTIHSPLNCLPGAGWEPLGHDRATLEVRATAQAPPSRIAVNRLVIRKGLDRALVLYWYQSHGRVTASEYWGRALLVWDALRTSRTDGALVRIIAPIASAASEDAAASEHAATSFVQSIFPLLGRFLPE